MAIGEGTILRVVASLLLPGNVIAQNIFYTVLTAAGGSDDPDDVVSDMADWLEDIYDAINASVSDEVSASDVKVYEYDSVDDDWDEVGTDSWVFDGTQVADMAPHGVACISHAKTLDPDVQGTKYWPGFYDGAFADSDLTGDSLTRIAGATLQWITQHVGALTGATFTSGVWSVLNTNFWAFNGVSSVNGIVGYQRRRKPGVGI